MFMRYDYLAEFLVVAEEGSIARAAEKLSLSPSSISKHLAALESYLGAELLVRSRHCHELTEAGRAVVETGAGLLDIGERVLLAARARRALKVCSLFDSVSCYRLLTQGIRRFESEGKGVRAFASTRACLMGTRSPRWRRARLTSLRTTPRSHLPLPRRSRACS